MLIPQRPVPITFSNSLRYQSSSPKRTAIALCFALAIASLSSLLTSCASGPRDIAENRPYPIALRQDGSIDIQVIQKDTTLELTNATKQTLAGGTLWLNGRFAHQVETLPPGARIELDLDSFIDEFGNNFKPGGFWASETPDRIILAQWEERTPGSPPRLVGLIAVSKIAE